MHPLAVLLTGIAEGSYPDVDGAFELHEPFRSGHLAVVEFTGHAVMLLPGGEQHRDELTALGADGFGGAGHPDVKRYVAGPTGEIGCQDAILVHQGSGGDPLDVGLTERDDLDDHPRVIRSRQHRLDVRVLADDTGLITIGLGLADRIEMSVELFAASGHGHGHGHGRRLIAAALHVAPDGPVWAQVSPGNAASLRAFLSCGFTPVGSETLIVR